MRTNIIALLLIVSVLLAGCTPAASDGDTAQVTSQPASVAETQGTVTTSVPASTSAEEPQSNPSETSTSIVTSGTSSESVLSWPEPPAPTPIVPDDDGQAGDPPAEQPGPPVSEEPTPELNWAVQHEYWFPQENPYEDSYTPAPNNTGVPDDYISVEYNIADLLFSFDARSLLYIGYLPLGIGTVNHAYPIECLRQIDENTYYAVYRAQQGGYLYVHFERVLEEPVWDETYYNGIFAVTGVSYARETHSYADFADIKIGDPVSKVEAVDSSVLAYYTLHNNMHNNTIPINLTLTDGYLFIECAKNENNEYTVSQIRYYPDGIEDVTDIDAKSLKWNYNILPQDFPQ